MIRLARTTMVILALACTAAGCEEDKNDAPQKCEAFIELNCTRLRACFPNDPTSQADCIALTRQEIDCSAAKGVDDSYDTCIRDLGAASCTALNAGNMWTLPASCNRVILFDAKDL